MEPDRTFMRLTVVLITAFVLAAQEAPEPTPVEKAKLALKARQFAKVDELLEPLVEADPPQPEVLLLLARAARGAGKLAKAETLLKQLTGLDIHNADWAQEYGDVLLANRKYQAAEDAYQIELTERSLSLGLESLALIPSMHRVIGAYFLQQKFDSAQLLTGRVITMLTMQKGQKTPELAPEYSLRGRIFLAMGEPQPATLSNETALKILEENFGTEDARLLQPLDSLVQLYKITGRVDTAEAALLRALSIREANVGPAHPDVAQTLDSLALLYFQNNRVAEAEPLYRRSLEIWSQALGGDHVLVAGSLDNLAAVLMSLDRAEEAGTLYQRALTIRDREDAANLHHLAFARSKEKKYAEAANYYKRALAVVDAQPKPDSAAVEGILREYADCLQKLNRPAEAIKIEARAKALRAALEKNPPASAKPVAR
jgi:tetratricopeptide (TPR) repeat protein